MPIILITGSEGNIGTYLVKRLKETKPNFEIIRVGHKKIDDNPGEKEKIYIGDLTDEFLLKKYSPKTKLITLFTPPPDHTAAPASKRKLSLFLKMTLNRF